MERKWNNLGSRQLVWGSGVDQTADDKNGLYSIQLVKTNHKNNPVALLGETELERGEWNAATANTDGIELLAVKYKDLQDKQFISTCSIISTTLTNQT